MYKCHSTMPTGFSEINHFCQINYTIRKHKGLFRDIQRRCVACGRSFLFPFSIACATLARPQRRISLRQRLCVPFQSTV